MTVKSSVKKHNAASDFRHQGLVVIGLTGGMASGKSFVMSVLCEALGGVSIDADQVCGDLLKTGEKGWKLIQREFGRRFLTDNNDLDRKKLRCELFRDEGLRHRLNAILHPAVKEEISARLAQYAENFDGIVLVEVPLLYEAGWEDEFDKIIAITASPAQSLEWLIARDKVTRQEAELSLGVQAPLEMKAQKADFVVDNSDDKSAVRRHVHRLALALLAEYGQKKKIM